VKHASKQPGMHIAHCIHYIHKAVFQNSNSSIEPVQCMNNIPESAVTVILCRYSYLQRFYNI
jgi:hypothetical protein